MNANKLIIILVFLNLNIFSQKKDVFFVLNEDHNEYIFRAQGGKIDNLTNNKVELFIIYDRLEYESYKKNKKDEDFFFSWSNKIPKTSYFNVKKVEKNILEYCEIQKLEIIDYNWLVKNSWKENNPNILFKNLYFLFKNNENKFIKYKVSRTIVEH